MKWIIAGFITLYQKFLSSRKGYSCAHRKLHKGDSCSAAVKKIVLSQGLWNGYSGIRTRFQECRHAARTIKGLNHQALECSVDGCIDPVAAPCNGVGGSEGCFGGGESSAPSGNPVTIISITFGALLLGAIIFFWLDGRKINSIDIMVIDSATESRTGTLTRLLDADPPDYQIVLLVDGKAVRTNIRRNTSAANWIEFYPNQRIYLSDIKSFSITDKEMLKDRVLETIENPEKMGEGEKFKYKINRKWNFF